PEADVEVGVIGGQPDSGSDVLNFIGTGAGDVTLDLTDQTITEAGLGPVSFIDIETVNIDANAALIVDGTVDNDTINVTPVNAGNDGSFDHSGSAIGFNYTDAATVIFNGGGGNDLLNVVGDAADDVVTADGTTVDVDGSVVTLGTSIEAVQLTTLGGSDTIDITLVAAGGVSYDVVGGNPIGAVGDTLNVTSPTGLTFMAGPETDSGALVDGDGAIVSYDEIEVVGVTLAPAGAVVVMGSGADDDITAVGVGNDSVEVTVNDGPTITYAGVTSLTLQGKAGDDDITIDVNNAIDVEFIVDGGLPTAGSDELRITGDNGTDDAPTWSPDAVDGGEFALASLALPIVVDGIENLIYDGEDDDENLTVVAPAAAAEVFFAHHPALALDAGFMGLRNTDGECLGVNYENLGTDGTVTADGSPVAAADLTVLGTIDDDDVAISFSGANAIDFDLTSAYGVHVDILSVGVQTYEVQTLDGNDVIEVNGSVLATSLDILAGSPGGSDEITFNDNAGLADTYVVDPDTNSGNGTVVVNGVNTAYDGVEHLIFVASGDLDDALTINDDAADNQWLLDAGPVVGDRVEMDDRETIDFDGFDTVELNNDFGTDTFTIHPTNLVGFNTSLTINGDTAFAPEPVDDVVTFVGTEAADAVTTTATAVTVNGVEITVGNTNFAQLNVNTLGGDDDVDLDLALDGVHKVVDLGAGNDSLDASGMLDGDFFGGIGNDTIIGSPLGDRIFGGPGNDILIGGGGSDYSYGEEGNDIFGNPSIAANGVADDPGTDFNFGGPGFDNFIWEPGDGADFNNGGDDQADIFRFFGNAAGSTFTLRSGGTPTHFNALFGGVVVDNHGIEDVRLDPAGGNDTIIVNDLFQTEVVNVTILAGGGDETVTVNGRTTADHLNVTSPAIGSVGIEGLTYDVNITGAATADSLTINTVEGDDSIAVDEGVQNFITSTLNGGDGDDHLSGAFNTANANAGDDTIIGGSNDQTINGGAGEDTMVGGGGQDTYDGGADFDTILIGGTSGADTIDVRQSSATTLQYIVTDQFGTAVESATVAGATQDIINNVEQAKVDAGAGADTIRLVIADDLFDDAGASLRMAVVGGDDAASDRLAVVDHATADVSILRQDASITSGTVEIGPANVEPFLHTFDGVEFVQVVADTLAPFAPVNIESPGIANRLVVFKHDQGEQNNSRNNATHLGANTTVNLDPNIDPGPGAFALPADTDWYRVEALVSGTIDFQVFFEHVNTVGARPGLPGNGDLNINVFDSDGDAIANFTTSDDNDDNERVRIPAVQGEVYFFQVLGDGNAINAYDVTTINLPAPVPFDLELTDNPTDGATNPPEGNLNSDTGRSQFDNITYDDTPTLILRLDDGLLLNDLPGNNAAGTPLGDAAIQIPFRPGLAQPNQPGYAIAIFDEGATAPAAGNGGGLNIRQPLGFATQIEPGLYSFTVPNGLALNEGSHFLTAKVQMLDPANPLQTGFGERSASLEIIVDRTEPDVVFGLAADATDGLHPDSDSGDAAISATKIDRITNDETPTFFGRAEANSIVRLYVDLDGSNTLTGADLLIGQTTATPLDGTDQLETPANPNEPGGQWEITSTVNMNDPAILTALGLGRDGERTILLSAEDVAGNITAPNNNVTLDIFVDTLGPQVTDVYVTGRPDFNIFTVKPETPEPTPRVDSLTIEMRDLPPRIAAFLYPAVSNVPPLAPIVLVGDHWGVIAIEDVTYIPTNNGPGVATGQIVIDFASPLPDDRFTLTLADSVIDPAGNQLDGESNAAEPVGNPLFPTGDAISGGDFIARFTVDSRPEIATWSQGVVYADINGNMVWDPEGQDNDAVNRDFVYNFGELTDAYFTGNFAFENRNDSFSQINSGPDGILGTGDDIPGFVTSASGFDKLGAYGAFNGQYQFFLDTNDDGVGDFVGTMAYQVNAIPVAGDFNAAHPGDEIGAFDGRDWYLDVNGNNRIDLGEKFASNTMGLTNGLPVAGDFDGNGFDDLGTYNNATGVLTIALTSGYTAAGPTVIGNDTVTFGFSGFGEIPVVGDVNLDGIDDIVMWVPGREGQLPKDSGEFHFLVSDDPADFPAGDVPFSPFSPAPLGNDLQAAFGDDFALPLLGNFDPPIEQGGTSLLGSLTNVTNAFDVNLDGMVSPSDILGVINTLVEQSNGTIVSTEQPIRTVAALGGIRPDVNGDKQFTPSDILAVINELARQSDIGGAQAESIASDDSSEAWSMRVDSAFADDDDDEDELLRILSESGGTF
ncbi:MAG: calcium-binding protein, partial [Pirellulaceae bacterium]|nr:calcium-binding protein [Pirellulaceae bacterium]